MSLEKIRVRSAALVLLALVSFAAPAYAGSLTGALDNLFSAPESDSSSTPESTSQPAAPEPAPAPAPPPPPAASPVEPPAEFYPGAEAVYTTTDPLVGDSRGLIRKPDGSMAFVEKDVNGNVISEVPVPAGDSEMFKPTEPGGTVDLDQLPDGTWEVRQYDQDGNLVAVEPLSGQEKAAPEEEAPAPAPTRPRELPSASSTDPATGITTTSQGNADGSRTVTRTDADGNVLSQETMPPAGQGLPSASAYDPATGITTTAQGNADGSHTVTQSRDSAPAVSSAEPPAAGSVEPPASSEPAPSSAEPAAAPAASSGTDSSAAPAEPAPVTDPADQADLSPTNPDVATVESPAESILDDVDQPTEPPESVLDDLEESPAASSAEPPAASSVEPPAESILDDIEESEARAAADRVRTPTQVGRDVEQAAREGRVDANPEDWERNAAAGMEAVMSADSPEEVAAAAERNRQFQDDMTAPRRDAAASEALQRRLAAARVRAEEEARRERLAEADRESLDRRRQNAVDDLRRYEDSLDRTLEAEGRTRLTEAELLEQQRRETRMVELMELTPEEATEVERQGEVHHQVVSEIARAAENYGGLSEEEVAARAQNANMADAATKTWRDYTFTGRMVSEVQPDMVNQREQGIRNNNQVLAAQNYLRRTDITPEQRRSAEQYLAMSVTQRGHNAEAILYDGAVVLLGAAADVGTMAAGGTISRGVSKIMGTEAAQVGAQGGRAAAPPPAPPRAPTPSPAPVAPRVAPPVPPGTVPQAAAEAATVIESGGARAAAAQGAGEATTIIERGAAPAAGKPLSEMTRAELQAYNDALARRAVSNRPNLNESQVLGSDVLPPPPLPGGAAGQVAAETGQLSRNLSQAQIDDLFRPGVNLTRDQLLQKTDLMLSGRVHPAYRPPVPPGNVPPAAAEATTRLFPGRTAAQAAAEETGTVINPGRAPAPSFRSAPTEVMSPSASQITEAAGNTTIVSAERAAINAARAEAEQAGTVIERAAGEQ